MRNSCLSPPARARGMTALLATIALVTSATASARAHHDARPAVSPSLHGMQYLYGSAEAAALSQQTWHAIVAYVAAALHDPHHHGVVLAPGATLEAPAFVDCGDKPPAAVFDVDETVLLNLGAEYDDLTAGRPTFDQQTWRRWEESDGMATAPTPGATAALGALRAMGVAVVFNTNRVAANAARTAALLTRLGLGPATHGDTLYLSGDDATGSRKDGRRHAIAARFCVLAMAGDQLGDFTDRFNRDGASVLSRRHLTASPGIAQLWGNGWFVMPNPVYGTALRGVADDIFPKDKQWRDPGAGGPEEQHP